MKWDGKRVLVTGAGGFIGSHLTERLFEAGADVRAMVHYNSLGSWGWLDHSSFKENIEIIAGDICDRESVKRAIDGVDIVFHLAALIAIPYSYQSPSSYVRTNIEGTLNILQAARDRDIDKVIHTSTSEVYGTACYVPINETHPLQGQSPYSATKIGADKLVESFYHSFGLPVVTIRPFNTFGPRQSARAIIPTIITQCLTGEMIQVGNTHPTRDLNYVANTVDGFLLAASTSAAIGHTINLGSNKEISIGDLVHLISDIINKPIELKIDKQRIRPKGSEVERLRADNTMAKEVLGWEPAISLDEGLKITINWLKQNLKRYKPNAYIL